MISARLVRVCDNDIFIFVTARDFWLGDVKVQALLISAAGRTFWSSLTQFDTHHFLRLSFFSLSSRTFSCFFAFLVVSGDFFCQQLHVYFPQAPILGLFLCFKLCTVSLLCCSALLLLLVLQFLTILHPFSLQCADFLLSETIFFQAFSRRTGSFLILALCRCFLSVFLLASMANVCFANFQDCFTVIGCQKSMLLTELISKLESHKTREQAAPWQAKTWEPHPVSLCASLYLAHFTDLNLFLETRDILIIWFAVQYCFAYVCCLQVNGGWPLHLDSMVL